MPSEVSRSGVDRLRHAEVADEADRVEEGCEEDGVARYAVEEDEPAFHGAYPVEKRPYRDKRERAGETRQRQKIFWRNSC
jgi:hypothetical protein